MRIVAALAILVIMGLMPHAAANITPLAYKPPWALLALLLIVPVALLAANLLAAWPARRAARLRTAHILRTE